MKGGLGLLFLWKRSLNASFYRTIFEKSELKWLSTETHEIEQDASDTLRNEYQTCEIP